MNGFSYVPDLLGPIKLGAGLAESAQQQAMQQDQIRLQAQRMLQEMREADALNKLREIQADLAQKEFQLRKQEADRKAAELLRQQKEQENFMSALRAYTAPVAEPESLWGLTPAPVAPVPAAQAATMPVNITPEAITFAALQSGHYGALPLALQATQQERLAKAAELTAQSKLLSDLVRKQIAEEANRTRREVADTYAKARERAAKIIASARKGTIPKDISLTDAAMAYTRLGTTRRIITEADMPEEERARKLAEVDNLMGIFGELMKGKSTEPQYPQRIETESGTVTIEPLDETEEDLMEE